MDIRREFPGVNDSKKLTEAARDNIYSMVERRASLGDIRFVARFSSHRYIDRYGITRAVYHAIEAGLKRLEVPHTQNFVRMDGLLKAPAHWPQETIIRGDERVPLIGLASIVAKVRRDRLMRRLSREYPEYNFAQHKGYPTAAHYQAIEAHGLCDIHRRTYCKFAQEMGEYEEVDNSLDALSGQV